MSELTDPTGYTSRPYVHVGGALAVIPAQRTRSLAEIAAQGTHFQIRPPRSGIGRASSSAEHRALTVAAQAGRVLRGGKAGQASVRTLTALARRGLMLLVAHPGSRRTNWSHGLITPAGRAELARLDSEQAQRCAFAAATSVA